MSSDRLLAHSQRHQPAATTIHTPLPTSHVRVHDHQAHQAHQAHQEAQSPRQAHPAHPAHHSHGGRAPSGPSLLPSPSPSSSSTLPERDVTPDTIEDAYVRFIFYCNPALPRGADTQSLREAFRNPPRSGGKLFSPYTIFDLVKKFYAKEIKTWTELTTRLGVEPPDPGKDESTQKIAQYGVRLKKWMNSMHIKAFFEYLMGIPSDYWTNIPDDPDPIALPVRDGIAVEDDMALRALLPHIRPKRGRKRPDEERVVSPSQMTHRQRLSPASVGLSPPASWAAQTDARSPSLPMDTARLGGAAREANDPSLPSISNRWSNPAPGPAPTRSSFWDDALEARPSARPSASPSAASSATPAKTKLPNHRRGAKNVSSAWKTGGWDPGSSNKTRGRPPINPRPGMEGRPSPPNASWALAQDGHAVERLETKGSTMRTYQETTSTSHGVASRRLGQVPAPPAQILPPVDPPSHSSGGLTSSYETEASGKRGVLAQTPERAHGHFQRPSPSAAVAPLGHSPTLPPPRRPPMSLPPPPPGLAAASPASTTTAPESDRCSHQAQSPAQADAVTIGREIPKWYFEKLEDRTNIDPILSYFTHVLHNADWVDPDGNRQEPAGLDECTAMTNVTVEQMFKSADSTQAFLINLAALAGARMLMAAPPKCYREEVSKGVFAYYFSWQYCFGNLSGQFTMTHQVPVTMWKKTSTEALGGTEGEGGDVAGPPESDCSLTAEQWQVKYRALMDELERRDRQILDMRDRVLRSL